MVSLSELRLVRSTRSTVKRPFHLLSLCTTYFGIYASVVLGLTPFDIFSLRDQGGVFMTFFSFSPSFTSKFF